MSLLASACVGLPIVVLCGYILTAYALPSRRAIWAQERIHELILDEFRRRRRVGGTGWRPQRVLDASVVQDLCRSPPSIVSRATWSSQEK